MGRYVVAVDGSPESAEALRWASRRCEKPGDHLCVVTAFRHPDVADAAGLYQAAYAAARASARDHVLATVEDVLGHRRVEHVVVAGSIDRALQMQAHNATALVIGTRNTSAWWKRLRPSLTNRLTGRVPCPVISIPPRTQAAGNHSFGSGRAAAVT